MLHFIPSLSCLSSSDVCVWETGAYPNYLVHRPLRLELDTPDLVQLQLPAYRPHTKSTNVKFISHQPADKWKWFVHLLYIRHI